MPCRAGGLWNGRCPQIDSLKPVGIYCEGFVTAQKPLACFRSQRCDPDSQRREKRSPALSVKDTGKGWGAFLTAEHAIDGGVF